jgi:hypothetical protein
MLATTKYVTQELAQLDYAFEDFLSLYLKLVLAKPHPAISRLLLRAGTTQLQTSLDMGYLVWNFTNRALPYAKLPGDPIYWK